MTTTDNKTGRTPAIKRTPLGADAKPLPVMPGKRSNGKADRSGDPRQDRAVRAARAAKKAPIHTAEDAMMNMAARAEAKATEAPAANYDAAEAIAKLTVQGREAMTLIATGQATWFDNGLVEGSGIWGSCFSVKPGVLTGLRKQGLLAADHDGKDMWWSLTELGALVAKELAAGIPAAAPVAAKTAAPKVASPDTSPDAKARDKALEMAGRAATAEATLRLLTEAASLRNARAFTLSGKTHKPLSATMNPAAMEGSLVCGGACGQTLPVSRFPFIGKKEEGRGRYIECGACQDDRLAVNKVREAAGLVTLPRPRATI